MRIAAPAPNASADPRHPPSACTAANLRCTDGWPRRVSLASIRSSCTSALACSSSSAAAAA